MLIMIIIDATRAILEENNSDDESTFENEDTVQVALEITTTTSSTQKKDKENKKSHDYKTAILSAFNAINETDKDREKKTLIAQLGELEPIAYIDHEGKEHDLLAAPEVIKNLVTSQEKDQSSSFFIVPKKRKIPYSEME